MVKIGSQDMNDEVWLTLAKRVNALLARDDVDGIVITHGTDTTWRRPPTSRTLTVKSDKPVVLVGAMRPPPRHERRWPHEPVQRRGHRLRPASGRGVMVAMNDTVLDARDVTKTNTTGCRPSPPPTSARSATSTNGKDRPPAQPRPGCTPARPRST